MEIKKGLNALERKDSLTNWNNSFDKISIGLASPQKILERSYGEVTKPETINYRSFKPEKDGLFCERIFGPVKDYECHCGKYKRVRYKGIVCDRCGVEVTTKNVRRERMGHISLAVPVVHIWFFKSLPSKIGVLLNITPKELEKVIYYESYVVIQPGKSNWKRGDLISEEQYFNLLEQLGEENRELKDDDPDKFIASIGGDGVKKMLQTVDVEAEAQKLRVAVKTETSQQKKADALKRLRVVEAFRQKDENGEYRNKPEWMILDVIPVIPPELRPLVPLEGGRFATSDLNDLYRRVIIRNNRLKKLLEIQAPEVILRNEKRMLQGAVDSLFDNTRRGSAVRSDGNRPLKSLSDMLRGKQGRFRQNLLGKRVDYSGRSVIVVGPELKLYECGLPKDMAIELFKPFIIRKLVERGYSKTVKSAKKQVEKRGPEIWDILEDIIDDHPVLLNRAPTLHRLGIQAFQPKLIEGRAIRLHPLVCTAFNADFNGDQMAVHVPLSYEAQLEAKVLMLSSHNILSPASGRPITVPSQDIVLGCYYLSKIKSGALGEGMIFASPQEAIIAFNDEKLDMHARVKVRIDGEIIETTVGRVIFNQIVPREVGYVNELLSKKKIEALVFDIFKRVGNLATSEFLDALKNLGYEYAMRSGTSFSLSDVVVPDAKYELIEKAKKEVRTVQEQYDQGFITENERYNKVIDTWTHTTQDVADVLFEVLKNHRDGFNSLFMMSDSGARGSKEQIRQLAGMRGLMAKPQKNLTGSAGEIIENPITSNFLEGLTVLEYFISTHGARKGLADTALKTADAGYLTRRLVDVAQDVVVLEEDCGTIMGLDMTDLKEGEEVIESLYDRILGRVAADDIFDPVTEEILVEAGELINEENAAKIRASNVDRVKVRSVLTCQAKRGICAKCYGMDMAGGKLVEKGEAVGIIAAQSIGEPGTQLTLRTFHIGGTSGRIAVESEAYARANGKVHFENLKSIERNEGGEITITRNGELHILDSDGRSLHRYNIPYGAIIDVSEGDMVTKGDVLYSWDPYSSIIVAEKGGKVEFNNLSKNVTYVDEQDAVTGTTYRKVTESKVRGMNPFISIVNKKGEKVGHYVTPTGAYIVVEDGQEIHAGQVLLKLPKEAGKTKDITGGLPRVAELFEARRPKNEAVISEIDGIVSFGEVKRNNREIFVSNENEKRTYSVSYGVHVLVHEGDFVKAGDQLSEGNVAPHEILKVKGPNAVQEYLVNEIQEVYRLQGVKINDKHIEVIVRQMMQKMRIIEFGDTNFLEEDLIDRYRFHKVNEEIRRKVVITDPGDSRFKLNELVSRQAFEEHNDELRGQGLKEAEARPAQPATSEPTLLGITQAALSTDSFISAASFQETTKVLTEAAISGKSDQLWGLKENIVMGQLIPAGTGLENYEELSVYVEEELEVSSSDVLDKEADAGDE
jgi:DNA-directed RNA polymerase subunit beta'